LIQAVVVSVSGVQSPTWISRGGVCNPA